MSDLVRRELFSEEQDIVIDIGKIIGLIWQRKVVVLLTTTVLVITALLYSSLTPKIYRTKTILEASSVESPATLSSLINQNYFNNQVAKKLNLETSALPKMIANTDLGTNFVVVSINSKDVDLARRVLSALNDTAVSEGPELFYSNQKVQSESQKKMEDRFSELEAALKQTSFRRSIESNNPILNLSYMYTLDRNLTYIQQSTQIAKDLLNLKKRKIILPPDVLPKPLWPRPIFIISLAAMGGLLLGIFVAIAREKRTASKRG
ncbi:MAG: hypothetical protein HY606_11485 [Planctomycetes bacterium]|nr:hypothetical protein [Planctomycetota bacterium]